MRKGWEYKKLGDCFSYIKNGANIKQKKDADGFPITRIETLSGGVFNRDRMGYAGIHDLSKYADYVLESKDLLMSHINSKTYIGRTVEYKGNNEEAIIHGMNLLRLKAIHELIDSTFFAYYTQSGDFKSKIARIRKDAVNQSSFAISDLKRFDIPLPPKSTQLAIVSELDKINELIRLKKEQLKDFDNLAQSLFYEMFGDPVENEKGWEVKKLGEISSLICNGNTPKGGSEVYVDNGILFLRSQNVWKNRLDLDDVAFIDEATHKSLKKSALNHNDLLITKTGRVNTENSSLGRTALFEGEDGSANINGHVYLVRLKEGMVHKYVLYILISNSYRELIRRTCVGGIDKRQLNKNHIEDFPIIFPPLPLQRLFAQRIEQIEREKSEVQKSIQDLETLLASRMQYWFE